MRVDRDDGDLFPARSVVPEDSRPWATFAPMRVASSTGTGPRAIRSVERLPVAVGHGDECPTVLGLTDLVDRADVGVIQGRRGSGFSQEASLDSFFPAEMGRQELQGDEAVQPQVSGLVEHPHAALAE